MLGELLLEVRDAGADERVNSCESERAHLMHGFIGGPAFVGYAIGCDGHAGAVVAEAAMDKNLLFGILRNYFEKSDERLVIGKRAVPWDRNVLHAEFGDGGLFIAVGAASHVDNDGDSHRLEAFEALDTRLASTVETRSDPAEVRDTGSFLVCGNGVRRVEGTLGASRA